MDILLQGAKNWQLRAVRLSSARDVTGHVDRTGGSPCRDLRLDALAVRGDSRIAVHHAHMMHISFAQGKPSEIKKLIFVRKL